MEQVFLALAETVIPWIEDRYGRLAAWVVAALLIVLPITAVVIAAAWLLRSV